MTRLLIALVVLVSIGAGIANGAPQQQQVKSFQQQGDRFNFLEGGGG
ncbi:MAG: hypothetical protein ACJ8AI_08940 [Rhodopila sp.]